MVLFGLWSILAKFKTRFLLLNSIEFKNSIRLLTEDLLNKADFDVFYRVRLFLDKFIGSNAKEEKILN